MAPIEEKQHFGRAVAQAAEHAATDVFSRPGSAEALAFEAQECDFVDWIHGPQAGIELQAVDNPDRVIEPDVFRTEITMSVDNPAIAHAFRKQTAYTGKKVALHTIDSSKES
jgi:hypothetical protein